MSAATLAKLSFRLNRASTSGSGLPGIILMTDPERLPDPLLAADRLPAGSAIILRHYDFWNREDLGRHLMNICRQRHVYLLVSADYRLAWKIGAHGVHLPEALAKRPPLLGRRPGWLVTAAAHSLAALNQAARIGADAALLSPVFATQSHPGVPTLGAIRFAAMARKAALPVYALGGVSSKNVGQLAPSRAVGVAAISGLAP